MNSVDLWPMISGQNLTSASRAEQLWMAQTWSKLALVCVLICLLHDRSLCRPAPGGAHLAGCHHPVALQARDGCVVGPLA